MNYEQFAIWLHGFLEISNAESINKNQTQIIKDHLTLLFEKKTPDRSEKKDTDFFEGVKNKAEELVKRKLPISPVTTPTYPGFDPYKLTCGQGTGASPQQLPTSICINEIPLGEQFECVDMKFDTESHKNKTYC
jgi:hypothetical protein